MQRLSIRVLGPLQVTLGGEPVSGFASDKVRALLAYLALSPDRPHRREALAGLLWPEFPERSARNSLRTALANLRKAIGDRTASGNCDTSPPFVHSTRQTVHFNGQSDYWLDAEAFVDLLASLPSTREALEQAIGLVRGTFLEGFTLSDSAPFEEWLLLRREHFRRETVAALDNLAAICEGQGAYEQALTHARRRVELEPWQEEGQRQLMRLLARSGHRSEAMAQYKMLYRSLQEELGAEPSAETAALWEAIRSGELAPQAALWTGAPVPLWNLPASVTPFFGRVGELATLEHKLGQPDARLVTLTGLGGSGKTRLALELGSRLAERDRQALLHQLPLTFAHGIVFAPLAALDSVEGFASALADALQLRLEGGQEQLLEFLRPKQLLLILDNLEQLPGAAAFLSELLCSAPDIKILTTSCERLQMQGEHVLLLDGLPYPAHDFQPTLPEAVDVDTFLAEHPALQLLTEGIRRVCPGFVPGSTDLPALLDICRLADGLPLALELAASWADALSPTDILAQAQRSLDFWQMDWPALPDRQRSIRALFDVSWQRLDSAEQATFSSLTVFRGGFTREAAEQVVARAEASPRLLAALLRKSFLQYDRAEDRYGIHELLRQYGAEKLAQEPDRVAEAHDRHSDCYARALQQWEEDLSSGRLQSALIEAEAESDNIRTAWYWAVEHAHFERLDRAMEGLYHFCWHSGRYQEADVALGAAAAAAAAGSAAKRDASKATGLRVAVRALAWQSEFCRALGKRDSARRLQQQGLTLLKEPALSGCDTRLERAILSWTMGLTAWITDYERASKHFEESFSLFSELEHKWGLASALMNWGTMNMLLCSFQNAERQLEEALTIWRVLGSPVGVADCLSRLAIVASTRGRLEKAEHLAREGYAMSLQAGSRLQAGQNQLYLGRTLEDLGRFSEAHALVQKSLALLSAVGHRVHLSHVPGYLARILMHLGKYEQAREHSEAGLASARKYGPGWCVGLNLDLQGCLDLAAGAPARAYDHFQDAIAVYRDVGERDDLAWGFSVFAFAALALGNAGEARHHLLAALQLAVDLGMYGPPLLWALPAAALLLNDEGEKERAVELYALASRYDLVAKSRWFADMVGKQIAAAADTLTAERVAILQESGRTRNLEAMAAELLAELCE